MAKRIVVVEEDEEKTPQKKKHRCLTCCLTAFIVFVVILAVAFGVGWYFGDKYLKENFDMDMRSATKVVTGLYGTKDKDVVSNPYSDSDLNAFYDEIKTNILLKADADVDFDAALSAALDKFLNNSAAAETNNGDANNGAQTSAAEGGTTDEATDSSGEIIDIIVNMISDVFTRDNIDIERLKAYTEGNDDYIFELNDKQLASFIDTVLDSVLASGQLFESGSNVILDSIDLANSVALKQVRFTAVSSQNEIGEEEITATAAEVTVWVGLQNAAGQALTGLLNENGLSWLSGFARWLGNVILPKNLYATITVPISGDGEVGVYLNNMTSKERADTYKLINGVMGLTGSNQTVEGMLTRVGDQLQPYLEAATKTMDFSSAAQGTIKLDLIDTMVEMANKSLNTEADPLTKADFMYMLQAVLTSDPEARLKELTPYLYTGWYRDAQGNLVHSPADTTGMTAIDYETEFIREIEDKYSVNFGEEAAHFTDVLAMLGISLDGSSTSTGSSELLTMIDAQKFHEALERNIEDLKLNVTDRMLAAALSSQLDSLLTSGDSGFSDLKIKLDALTFISNAEREGHLYALLAVEVDVTQLLGSMSGDNILTTLASGILPEKLLLSVIVDITQSLPVGDSYDAASFMLNDYVNTDRVISTMSKLIPSLDLSAMTEEIETMLRDMILNLDSLLGITLVPSVVTDATVTPGALVMPDIFTVVTDMVLVDETTGESVVTPDEFKSVLRELADTSGYADLEGVAQDYSAFIADVEDKYYINSPQPLKTFAELTSFIGTFSSEKFNIIGSDPATHYLAYDTRTAEQLKPVLTGAQLGALIKENMTGISDIQSFNIEQITTGVNELHIILSIATGSLLPDQVKAILPIDKMYVTADVDLSTVTGTGTAENPHAYGVNIKINNMNAQEYANTLKIVRFFTPDFDVESQVANFGEILYTQLNNLSSSLGGDDFISFTANGVEMISFYGFLANQFNFADSDENTVKAAIQGMYARSETPELANTNNYAIADFIVNPSTASEWDPTSLLTDVTDVDFNGFFASAMKEMSNTVTAVQTIVLAAGDNSDKASAVRTWINTKMDGGHQIDSTKDYLVVTFRMRMGEFMSSGKDNAGGFMPDFVYATVVIEKQSSAFVSVGTIFNNMDPNAYSLLLNLMGLSADATDPNTVNIETITNKSLEVLNSLSTEWMIFSAVGEGESGIGKISLSVT